MPPVRRKRVLVLALALPAAMASAQTPAADPPVRLPPIDVNAGRAAAAPPAPGFVATEAVAGTKLATPLLATPQSVSVVPRDSIDALQAQSLGEALRYNAGVRGESYGPDARADFLVIRGFDAVDSGYYLDGLRYSVGFAAGALETYGLQRFEVVRGPNSVLYGQIQPGGLINQVSRRPTLVPTGEIRTTFGDFGRVQGAGTTSGPIDRDGVWSYSLTALGRIADSQVDKTANDRVFVAPALTWRPDNDTRLTLHAYYQRDRTQGAQFLPYLGTVTETPFGRLPTRRFVGEPGFDKYDITQWGIGSEFERRINDQLTLRQNTRWAHSGINWRQTVGLGLLDDARTLARIGFIATPDIDRFQADNQAEFRFTTGPLAHTLLAGFDYSTVRLANPQAFGPAPTLDVFRPAYGSPVPLPSPGSNTRQNTAQYGLYAQDRLRLGERWVLTGGVRHDWVDSDTLDRIGGGTQRQRDTATTGRVGLVHLAPGGFAPHASYATSFLPTPGTDSGGRAFRPRAAEQVEVGVKWQPPGRNSFIQAAAFQITQSDSLATDPANPLFQVQTGEIRVRGLEVEAVANPVRGLNLIASFTYTDPVITKGAPEEVGNRPAGIPAYGAGAYADYAFDEAAGALAGVGVGGGVRFLGNTTTGNAAHNVVPSVTLVDAAIRYDLDRFGRSFQGAQIAVTANNLFDTAYVARCTSDAACFYGNRRTVLASLVKRW